MFQTTNQFLLHSDILSHTYIFRHEKSGEFIGSLRDIFHDILCDMRSGILSGILSDRLGDIYCDFLSGILSHIDSDIVFSGLLFPCG